MTNQGRNYMEGMARVSGLTWQGLASRLGLNDRRRLELRLPAGPGQRRGSGRSANPDTDRHGG